MWNFDTRDDVLHHKNSAYLADKHEIFIVLLTDNDELQTPGRDMDVHPRYSTTSGVHSVHFYLSL